MKLREFISYCLLAVYTLVLAHNIIPHHHHSEISQNTQHCAFDKHLEEDHDHACDHHNHEHKEHTTLLELSCCEDHHHNGHEHTFCSFEEKIILTKGISLSNLFLPSNEVQFSEPENFRQSYSDTYITKGIQKPYCRDVQLRGPPHFS